jgi:hypothetical protein
MDKGNKILIILVVVVIGIILVINYLGDDSVYDSDTMQCIADNSILIASKTCSHCIDQKKILGSSYDLFNVVYADESPGVFEEYDLVGVPAWIINEETYYGAQEIIKLKELTGC